MPLPECCLFSFSPIASPGLLYSPLKQLEVRAIHLEQALVDLPVDLEHSVVARGGDSELLALASHHAGDELHLARAALDVIVKGGGAAAANVAQQRFHRRHQILVDRTSELVGAQPE